MFQSTASFWEMNDQFHELMTAHSENQVHDKIKWLDFRGSPVDVGRDMTVEERLGDKVCLVERGEMTGDIDWLKFRDPNSFLAG
jgi:hypothetical protein